MSSPNHELVKRQIASLHQYSPVKLSSSLYEIKLYLPTTQLSLLIDLPPGFPQDKPVIYTQPKTRLKSERLDKWQLHSSLAKVIEQIILDLTLNPVEIISEAPALPPGKPILPQQSKYESPARKPVGNQIKLSVLEKLSDAEVEEFLKDDDAFQEFFNTLEEVVPTKELYDDLMNKNAQLATANLSTCNEIDILKSKISQLLVSSQQQRSTIDTLVSHQQRELTRFSNETMERILRDQVHKQEEISDNLSQLYIEGKIGDDEFGEKYREARAFYHELNIKLEKAWYSAI